ncbi:hypothetical protein OSCI_2320007 [Kamptonema sp. PCC 6506]|nr:hypothetical protein OSCI_2320007 [Kamptonema sp. PCC 6506]
MQQNLIFNCGFPLDSPVDWRVQDGASSMRKQIDGYYDITAQSSQNGLFCLCKHDR